jgi:hypothetical protein
VSESAVEFQGESIPIHPENITRLREAVEEMQKQAGDAKPRKRSSLESAERQLHRCFDSIEARLAAKPDFAECQRINSVLSAGADRLVAISKILAAVAG